ncbi:MAG: hypothetical protein Q7R33_08220, partial [Nitrosarchaeum sp.]|nr:hypothetical protein [Nitrosarchaeum sp.]
MKILLSVLLVSIGIFVIFQITSVSADDEAPLVKSVQRGTLTFSGTVATVNINAVNANHSMIVHSFSVNESVANRGVVSGNFINSSQIIFQRRQGTSTVYVSWYVIEFEDAVDVQHNVHNGGSLNITINSANTSSSFESVSMYGPISSGIFGADDVTKVRLVNSTVLELDIGGTVPKFWWLVSYPNSNVQRGTFITTGNNISIDINSVDLSKSFVYMSYIVDGHRPDDVFMVNFTNSSRIHFNRYTSGLSTKVSWVVVEFTDDTTVQSGTLVTSNKQENVGINAVNLGGSYAFASSLWRQGTCNFGGDDNFACSDFTLNLTNSTSLNLSRTRTDGEAKIGWFVVDFPTGGVVSDTTPPTFSNVAHNSTSAGQITSFSVYVNDDTALDTSGQYIFSTNNSGTWINDSAVNFTATPSWANVTKTLNSTVGQVIGYVWYLTDNQGNTNSTGIYTLKTSNIPQEVPSCGVLSNADTVYTLSSDLISNGTCLNVTASNVIIDCLGFSIIGNNSQDSYGVYSNQQFTTVKNCNISNFR